MPPRATPPYHSRRTLPPAEWHVREMTIESIRLSLNSYQRIAILREKDTDRYLTIWIGPYEAESISLRLHEVTPPRPQTHDLLRDVIEQLGATVRYVLLNDLARDTYYARIVLDAKDGEVQIDARPSDAISLAVRAGVPIYAEEAVLEQGGEVIRDEEAEDEREPEKPVDPAEIERLGPFKDFIEGLDLSGFDDPRR